MFMCTYVYVYVGTQQPYTRNTGPDCQTGLMNSDESTEIWSMLDQTTRILQKSQKFKVTVCILIWSGTNQIHWFCRYCSTLPWHSPTDSSPCFFRRIQISKMTDAKFEELARFNCTALLSPGALLFPRSTRSCKSRSWILKRTWSTDAVSTTINSAIQTCHGSTEFGSIRPLLTNSRRSKLNQEAQKQRNSYSYAMKLVMVV